MVEWKHRGRWVAVAASAVLPCSLNAQIRSATLLFTPPAAPALPSAPLLQDPVEKMDEEGRMTTSGFFLGVIGMLGGAAIGSGVGNSRCGNDCVGRYAATGASIVGAVMVPIGVHVAADKPRNLVPAMASSFLAGAVLYGAFNAFPGRPVALAPFVAAPLQVWLSMKIEAWD